MNAKVKDRQWHGSTPHVLSSPAVSVVVEECNDGIAIAIHMLCLNDNGPRLASWSRIRGGVQLDAKRLTSLALPAATAQRVCVVQKGALAKTLRERLCRVRARRQDVVGDALQCGCQHEWVEARRDADTLSATSAASQGSGSFTHRPPHSAPPDGRPPLERITPCLHVAEMRGHTLCAR